MKPLLIFTGALHPEKAVFERFMHDFDEPCFVIAADSGLLCAREFGYIPDLIVGDMDSLTDKSLLSAYPEDKIRIFERDKAESDTVLALEKAFAKRPELEARGSELLSRNSGLSAQTRKNVPASVQLHGSGSAAEGTGGHNMPIILCGGDGGRIDHLLGIVKQFERAFFPDIWLCREQAVYSLRPASDGKGAILKFAAERCAEHMSVFPVPVKDGEYKIYSEGLEWPLDNLDWKNEAFSLSNRVRADYLAHKKRVVLRAEKGAFIAIVPY
ncbi:thiamine pyrophosphokinase [Treponema sp. HNW]|uniref:thiamine pyrophosphokinase n=1 Tax=Treponema sp. HNW TaxID=3116654 RepID=UPI003D13A5C9